MSIIADNIKRIKSELPESVQLIAVSKTHPAEAIVEAYNAGQRIFGENKVQELTEKYENLKDYIDIKWHLIGHLQTNKVKYIAPFVDMIHSVDSLKLLSEINKQALKNSRIINCLLQFHIASEDTKFGLNLDEVKFLLDSEEYKCLKNVNICGVMGMATFSDNMELIRSEFKKLHEIFTYLKKNYYIANNSFKDISMGMSSDWKIAIEEGSTLIRVGSDIFGYRNYM
ncbi:YggS family pyridoxal phosphate-dependent enzyme [Bacteroidales bacterium OttesenSCG-928-I21]|nr:YggS family pyridoxal phosphate-dependent enzyme [Bacteroidales bacterium OttesenSCG-928-I21]